MDSLVIDIAVLVLAGFVGYTVISKVPNTLHTPLMSGTNAIHGIVVLGGLLLMAESSGVLEKVLLVIAVAFGTINVVGGFLVTDGELALDFEDEVIAGACITRDGEIVHAGAKAAAAGS